MPYTKIRRRELDTSLTRCSIDIGLGFLIILANIIVKNDILCREVVIGWKEWKHTAATALSARIHVVPLFHVSVSIVYVFAFALAFWIAVTNILRIDTRLLGLIARRLVRCKSTHLKIFTFSIFGSGIRFWTGRTWYGVLIRQGGWRN